MSNAFGYEGPDGPKDRQRAYRVRIVPSQLDKARRKYFRLVREAADLGMTDLLDDGELDFISAFVSGLDT